MSEIWVYLCGIVLILVLAIAFIGLIISLLDLFEKTNKRGKRGCYISDEVYNRLYGED